MRETAPALLICDDEELILESLRGLFQLETDYELILCSDPRRALEEAERRPVDLVIADFLMPAMNGVELLKCIRRLQPEAIRILLTGFADKESAIRAINEAGLYHYLEKPWDNESLLLLVRNALSEKSLRRRLTEKAAELDRLIEQHGALHDRHEVLSREVEMAARVQRALLPPHLPEVRGFRCAANFQPCSALGGDFYDAVTGLDRAVILLADVAGHGVQAALMATLLKSSFHDAAEHASGPVELLSAMNQRLHRFFPPGMFACASLVWIENEAELSVASAGLPHPFVLRAASGRVDTLPLNGMPLGLFGEPMAGMHDIRRTAMRTGDVLLLTTDGLGELSSGGRVFQDGPLDRTLEQLVGRGGEPVIAGVIEAANAFHGGAYSDDVTLLALEKV